MNLNQKFGKIRLDVLHQDCSYEDGSITVHKITNKQMFKLMRRAYLLGKYEEKRSYKKTEALLSREKSSVKFSKSLLR